MTKYTFSEHDFDNAKVVFATNWAAPSEPEINAFNTLIKETLNADYLRDISTPRPTRPSF